MEPQDQTFMTIHNLTPDANILFASESIIDILGYQPDEVLHKSCFDYFHPDEVPLARSVHSRGVRLDKAAVLHYARIRSKSGTWVSCECCFTIVHDVLVASTSIYSGNAKSEGRALTAPRVRRLFSSSPRDPRYHMLEHLSPKFKMPPTEREPRAALVLNRFTRNLTIMFATNAVSSILGLRPDELVDRPFYHCIQENCLTDAIACLESAKRNESIAYLRFWYRDPRRDDQEAERGDEERDTDEDEEDGDEYDNNDDSDYYDKGDHEARAGRNRTDSATKKAWLAENRMDVDDEPLTMRNRGKSDRRHRPDTSHQTLPTPPPSGVGSPHPTHTNDAFELEAVVSCTSDGLVVVLRRARPPIPDPQLPLMPAFNYERGLFAAPWSLQPIEPYYPPELLYQFRAPFLPQYMPLQEHVKAAGGPPRDQLMRSIRDVAVFAWAVVGINGNLANYGHGLPGRGAQPPKGLPIWYPTADLIMYRGPDIPAVGRYLQIEGEEGHALSRSMYDYSIPRTMEQTVAQNHSSTQFPPPINPTSQGPASLARSSDSHEPDSYEPVLRHRPEYRCSPSRHHFNCHHECSLNTCGETPSSRAQGSAYPRAPPIQASPPPENDCGRRNMRQ